MSSIKEGEQVTPAKQGYTKPNIEKEANRARPSTNHQFAAIQIATKSKAATRDPRHSRNHATTQRMPVATTSHGSKDLVGS